MEKTENELLLIDLKKYKRDLQRKIDHTLVDGYLESTINLEQLDVIIKTLKELRNELEKVENRIVQVNFEGFSMKVDKNTIIEELRLKGVTSSTKFIEDKVFDLILQQLDKQIIKLTNDVISDLKELEHGQPKTKQEYDERFGLDKGE